MWVVNTVLAATASSAAAKSAPAFISVRARSSTRNAAWPSLMCQTVGTQSHRLERAHAADAEHDFLLDARVLVPAVEAVRNGAVGFAVHRHVGVEQVQPHMPHARLPDLHLDGAIRKIDRDMDLVAAFVLRRLDRQRREIGVLVRRLLIAVAVDGLEEIALAIQQAHADERQPRVAGRLAVIAREDAEAAGVDRQAFMEAEFGAEVGDQIVVVEPVAGASRMGEVRVVRRQDATVIGEIALVFRDFVQSLFVDLTQQRLRTVADRQPEIGIEARKQVARRAVPRVPEIVRELREAREPRRNRGRDFEGESGSGAGHRGATPYPQRPAPLAGHPPWIVPQCARDRERARPVIAEGRRMR